MSDDWERTTLGEIADLVGGGTPKTGVPAYWGGEIVWLTPSEVSKHEGETLTSSERTITPAGMAASSARIVPPGTVLVTSRATIGATAIAGCALSTNQGFSSLVPSGRVLSRFLMQWVQANKHELISRAGGNTFLEVSRKRVAGIPISLPPLGTQRRIVAVIDALDGQIEALRGEGEAVNAVLKGLLTTEMNHDGNQDTPFREFLEVAIEPETVEVGREYPVAGVLGSGLGLMDKGIVTAETTNYKKMNRLELDRLVMRKLTAWEGPITVVTDEFAGHYVSGEFPTFEIDRDIVDPDFLRFLCQWPVLWHEMKQRVTGSVQRRKRLSPQDLLSVSLAFPPVERQRDIALALAGLESLVEDLRAESERLSSVRSATLNALLSREIEITESFDETIGLEGVA